jgi:two-component system chemotaxis response regulator CheB
MPNLKSLKPKLILIGASTGGPGHIQKILENLESDFDSTIIIAQHMGEEYLPSFAKNLNKKCLIDVCMVEEGMRLEPSKVYVCSGLCTLAQNLEFSKKTTQEHHFNPDINTLFESVVEVLNRFEVMSVILTGIGEDGAKGSLVLFESGAKCLAESAQSAIVFGMPKRTIELCKDIEIKSIDEIVEDVQDF